MRVPDLPGSAEGGVNIVFFDLETGGLTDEHPNIQIAAIAVATGDDWRELETFERKLTFDIAKADPEALKLNHYDADVWWREGVAEPVALADFKNFLRDHADMEMISKRTGEPYYVAQLAGYNALTFDGPRLKKAFTRWSIFLPAHPRELCVLQQAAWWFVANPAAGKPASMKLGDVCAAFGFSIEGAHDALADIRATVKLARIIALRTMEVPA